MTPTIESRPWPEVVGFYRELVNDSGWYFQPMLDLVEFLAASPFAEGLFPTTSVARLCLARTPTIRWEYEMLIIEYDPVGGRFVFTYFETSPCPRPWVTGCPESEW